MPNPMSSQEVIEALRNLNIDCTSPVLTSREYVSHDMALDAGVDGLKLSKSRHRVERLKSLGNSVVVPLVTEIFKMIKIIESEPTP